MSGTFGTGELVVTWNTDLTKGRGVLGWHRILVCLGWHGMLFCRRHGILVSLLRHLILVCLRHGIGTLRLLERGKLG